MSSIYTALRSSRRRRLCGSSKNKNGVGGGVVGGGTAIVYGFPYLDTLKMCGRRELVPDGVEFYGRTTPVDLEKLTSFLQKRGKRLSGDDDDDDDDDAGICALITEVPSNPLLSTPDLSALRELADEYNFCLIVDDTIGNFANLNLLHSGLADVVCTSLTKIVNGRGDAMAGSLVVNEKTDWGRWMGEDLRKQQQQQQQQEQMLLWCGDAAAVVQNSHDFLERSHLINRNAEGLADYLRDHEDVDVVYYPKWNSSHYLYESLLRDPIDITKTCPSSQLKYHQPGYGGLMSILLPSHICQRSFYDKLDVAKGPSLGTNFTLVCPYTLLAHYHELDFAMKYGVQPSLLRISVGCEGGGADFLKDKFDKALHGSRLYPKIFKSAAGAAGATGTIGRGYSTWSSSSIRWKNNASFSFPNTFESKYLSHRTISSSTAIVNMTLASLPPRWKHLQKVSIAAFCR